MSLSISVPSRADAFALGRLDAHAQAALVAAGEVSATELTEAAIVRIEALDPLLNVLTFRDYETARRRAATATGPMAGVPWLLKDGLDYPGMPNRSGSRSRCDGAPGGIDFPFTRGFDAAGLIPLGKTNAPEFGLLPTTEPVLYGPTRNPWAADRSPGGSSGGAAAAVASGMVPVAHAADGGGSIRIPASCCGLVGLKPGRGANLRARDQHVMEDLLACDVLLSRSVRDVDWAFDVGAGQPPVPVRPIQRRLRIAVVMENLDGLPPLPEVASVIERTASLCADLGHMVERTSLPVDGRAAAGAFRIIWGYMARETVTSTAARLSRTAAEMLLEPWTLNLATWSNALTATDVDHLYRTVGKASDGIEQFFKDYDLILSPVLRRPALPIGDLAPTGDFQEMMALMFDYVSYTQLHNLSGNPALSLPLFMAADGVPIGSMFAAARGQEKLLLEFAAELELACPWQDRWPNCSVAAAALPSGSTGRAERACNTNLPRA